MHAAGATSERNGKAVREAAAAGIEWHYRAACMDQREREEEREKACAHAGVHARRGWVRGGGRARVYVAISR